MAPRTHSVTGSGLCIVCGERGAVAGEPCHVPRLASATAKMDGLRVRMRGTKLAAMLDDQGRVIADQPDQQGR